uniref:Transformer n=1 Tax=Trichogramma dendrolimi TaxID=114056 RepID=A0AA49X8N4_9HYME|nr:transformer [Trichogramma dendrolimi]
MRPSNKYDDDEDREAERKKRRLEWMIQQQKAREHERLKQKKIEEYERKRLEILKSKSMDKSSNHSDDSQHRYSSKHRNDRSDVMSKKFNSEDKKPFFNGPERARKISPEESRTIVVKIDRNIPSSAVEHGPLKYGLINPEDVSLKRRNGEGAKPLFEREEFKNHLSNEDVEEHRSVTVIHKSNPAKSPRERRSRSLSPRRHKNRSPSPRKRVDHSSSNSHRSRYEEYPKTRSEDRHRHRNSDRRSYSSERSHRREDSHRHRDISEHRRSSRSRYDSRDRDDRYHRDERHHSRRRQSEERQPPQPAYIPYPVFYGGFPPRPPMMMESSLPGMRVPVPPPIGRGRFPMPIRPPMPLRFMVPPEPHFHQMRDANDRNA